MAIFRPKIPKNKPFDVFLSENYIFFGNSTSLIVRFLSENKTVGICTPFNKLLVMCLNIGTFDKLLMKKLKNSEITLMHITTLNGIDRGLLTGMILIDLQKAFDTIDHDFF